MAAISSLLLLASLSVLPSLAGDLQGVEDVFDRPELLAKTEKPSICILDTEHPDVVRAQVKEKGIRLYKCQVLKRKVQDMTSLPCILVHYSEISWKEFAGSHVKAILLMAQRKRMNNELQAVMAAFIRDNRIPMIGFCGGQQMIAEAFGGVTSPMRKLKPGEPDPNPKYYPGRFKEWGFMPVRIVKRDPIFAGFGPELVVREMHAFEVTRLPAEFEVLASSDECKLEMIKHRDRLLYGTQFHPEAYDEAHLDGKKLLQNFFHLAGVLP